MTDPARLPVIIGVGQVEDRPADACSGLDPVALMAAALRLADSDAGSGWLARADSLAVVDQLGWPELNPLVDALATTLAIAPARRTQTPSPTGDSPVRLLDEAANRIASGATQVELIVGAEALRTAAARAASASHTVFASGRSEPTWPQRYGLSLPVDIYPLYENATRAAWGQSLAEAQAESGTIWALMAQVAADNPHAWLRTPLTAEAIVTPSADNRMIGFPYTKRMVANAAVNQGAGFIVTSLAQALDAGIAERQIVHVGRGAFAHEPDDIMARDRFDVSAAMTIAIEQCLVVNGVGVDDLDVVELYSCFPCVPKMARRVLGWPADRPASVIGGLTFAGGPIGNYMSHAIAGMVEAIRGGARTGLLFANGGYATQNHALILSADARAAASRPHDPDRQALADMRRGPVPHQQPDYRGAAQVESYTVFHDRQGHPRQGVIVARTPDGARCLARVRGDDAATIAFLCDSQAEPVGSHGLLVTGDNGLADWQH